MEYFFSFFFQVEDFLLRISDGVTIKCNGRLSPQDFGCSLYQV